MTPLIFSASDKVVAPVTASVADKVVAPVTASVSDKDVDWVTVSASEREAVPVTLIPPSTLISVFAVIKPCEVNELTSAKPVV